MAKRINDIVLSTSDLNVLRDNIKKRFYTNNSDINSKFTGTKESKIYKLLQEDIKQISTISISTGVLRDIMTEKHNGRFLSDVYRALTQYVKTGKTISNPVREGHQKIFWGVNQGLPAGAYIEQINGQFIPWRQLKNELEERVIIGCPRIIPVGCKVIKKSFYGKKDWVVNIVDSNNNYVASVWIGSNPYDGWSQDGLVRTGRSLSDTEWEVYQIFARFPDGSYKLLHSFV